MRLFLGFLANDDIKDLSRDIKKQAIGFKRNLLMFPQEKLFLNLKFVGPNIRPETLEMLIFLLKKYQGNLGKPKIEIESAGFGFKKEKYPSILSMKVSRDKGLEETFNICNDIIKQIGTKDLIKWKENNDNTFHISIARLKTNSNKALSTLLKKQLGKLEINEIKPFFPKKLYLLESIIDTAKINFKVLDEFSL